MMVYRLLGSVLFSFFATFFGIKKIISFCKDNIIYQPIRIADTNYSVTVDHQNKSGTPTMGGLAMAGTILLNILLFTKSIYPIGVGYILLIISFGFTGLLDDVYKLYYKDSLGFQGSKKLVIQLLFSSLVVLLIVANNLDYLYLPAFIPLLGVTMPLGVFIACFFVFIITGSGNAANITDGLDGLLSVPVILVCFSFIFIILLDIFELKPLSIKLEKSVLFDILIVLLSTIVCFLTFLIFNLHPAKIFMGDVGSLFVGAILGYTAILLKIEFTYALMSLLFIWETITSIMQVSCFILTKGRKRIFKMSPFHHHLEKCGWSEKKVVLSMWGSCLLCCVLSLVVYVFC
ncbi:MAG: phospho-N-acetylmuramoyl-pentapeptide-transferase [Rickettsiales bacterium]|jgi:phospho-N-acetylmuramoyl-pentapeptide-transferase|nr:phospho-N-acetylmuramoyl-pentapeptide-transferase [Rickettsiales bacterium]